MSAAERRESLVATTLQLMRVHGRGVTTRQIAEAEGVAEGTIFRQFASKEELLDAALVKAFDPGPFLARVEGIDDSQPLRLRLVLLTSIIQQRLLASFELMRMVGTFHPPHHDSAQADEVRAEMERAMVAVIGTDADQFAIDVTEAVHRLRLLAFAGSHPHISDGRTLTPDQIVDTVLDGVLMRTEH